MKKNHRYYILLTKSWLTVASLIFLSSCTSPSIVVPPSLDMERSQKQNDTLILGAKRVERKYEVTDTPKPPKMRTGSAKATESSLEIVDNEKPTLMVAFDQMPLPTFIQAVYGPVLKQNYSVDGAVAARTDLVTFHTPKPQTTKQMADLTRMLLKSYGIAVQDFGGVIRIVPDTASNSYSPQIRRGLAQPDTPRSLRPIFHYVEFEAVRVNEISGLLRTMFGSKIQAQDDPGRNAMLLSGQPEEVAAALEVIRVFDQPLMRGQLSKRVSPAFWTADEFSKRLVDVLSAEGYSVSSSVGAGTPILVLPIIPLNSVIIFSASETTLNHALKWAAYLDQPSNKQVGGTYFTYAVKYADAQALAKTLSELISPSAVTAAPTGSPAAAVKNTSKIVVNNATNSLIIQGGTPDEYRQWMTLLAELDKPTKSALIEVIVAEVALDNSDSLGVDWGYDQAGTPSGMNGVVTSAAAGSSGLAINFLSNSGLIKAKLSALASKSSAQILSSPKIISRNGETATIQVGDEVPIITSTQTTPVAGATNGLLSTVQYRSTGVVLKVRPVINSGNRIDLDISQEVSNAKITQTGVAISPTIGTRKVDTKLSLRDGSTVMLAGLISSDNNLTDSGVPLLKDIPFLGSLFKSSSVTNKKTELIILITPYIINDDFEAESITAAFQNTLGDWAKGLTESTTNNNKKHRAAQTPMLDRSGNIETLVNDKTSDEKPLPAPITPSEAKVPTELVPVPSELLVPIDKSESNGSSEVIMSKPDAALNALPDTPNTPEVRATGKAIKGFAPPVNGQKVDGTELLEELRRAVGK
jgi:general secretion pathway protein D